jgi:O-antigen ligase
MRSAAAISAARPPYSLAPLRSGLRAQPVFRVLVVIYLLLFIFAFGNPVLTRLESLAGILLIGCITPYCIGAGRGRILMPLPFLLLFGLMGYFWLNLLYHQDMAVRWSVSSAQYQRFITAMISVCVSYAIFLYLAIFRDFSFFFKVLFICLVTAMLLTILGQSGAATEGRTGGTFGGVNLFASSLSAMSALFLVPFAWQVSRRSGGTTVMIAVLVLLVLALILNILYTGSRQGMLLMASMILVAILAASSRLLHRPGVLVLPLAIAVFGTVAIALDLFDLSTNRYVLRLFNLLSFFRGEELVVREGSVFERALMAEVGLDLWRQRPLLGYGMDSFRHIGGFGTYSHNNFVDLLVGGGILALGIYVLAHLAVLGRFALNRHSPPLVRAVGSFSVLVLLLTGFTIVTYYQRAHLICFGVLAALPYAFPRPLPGAR